MRFGTPFEGLKALGPRARVIIDARVADLYAVPLASVLAAPSTLRIDATEPNKSLERMPAYVLHLLDHGLRRDCTLVAIGGGIIQDIVCFIAATLMRGLPWTFYPTTLLAQADSCIGSKSSINVGRFKNQLGTFTPPAEIQLSTDVLDTLDEADIRSGLGEIIKVRDQRLGRCSCLGARLSAVGNRPVVVAPLHPEVAGDQASPDRSR